MNCFMGYNPLVAKEVKITTWIKEFDGDSPVYPSFPNDGDCFVVFATDEDALTHNALSKKTYADGEWVDVEGGGGGLVIPTFTVDGRVWSCDMTYAEAKASYLENADSNDDAPCLLNELWKTFIFLDGEAFQEVKTDFADVPDSMTEGIIIPIDVRLAVLFGSDGNFYLQGVN